MLTWGEPVPMKLAQLAASDIFDSPYFFIRLKSKKKCYVMSRDVSPKFMSRSVTDSYETCTVYEALCPDPVYFRLISLTWSPGGRDNFNLFAFSWSDTTKV